jgi:hypothetical protein
MGNEQLTEPGRSSAVTRSAAAGAAGGSKHQAGPTDLAATTTIVLRGRRKAVARLQRS